MYILKSDKYRNVNTVDCKSFSGTHVKRGRRRRTHCNTRIYIYIMYRIARCLFVHGPWTFGFSIRINYYYCDPFSPSQYSSSFPSYISPRVYLYIILSKCMYVCVCTYNMSKKRNGISHLRKDFRPDDIITCTRLENYYYYIIVHTSQIYIYYRLHKRMCFFHLYSPLFIFC